MENPSLGTSLEEVLFGFGLMRPGVVWASFTLDFALWVGPLRVETEVDVSYLHAYKFLYARSNFWRLKGLVHSCLHLFVGWCFAVSALEPAIDFA